MAPDDLALRYIAELAGKPTDKFVMPVPSLNVINGGSHAGNRLACQESARSALSGLEALKKHARNRARSR